MSHFFQKRKRVSNLLFDVKPEPQRFHHRLKKGSCLLPYSRSSTLVDPPPSQTIPFPAASNIRSGFSCAAPNVQGRGFRFQQAGGWEGRRGGARGPPGSTLRGDGHADGLSNERQQASEGSPADAIPV